MANRAPTAVGNAEDSPPAARDLLADAIDLGPCGEGSGGTGAAAASAPVNAYAGYDVIDSTALNATLAPAPGAGGARVLVIDIADPEGTQSIVLDPGDAPARADLYILRDHATMVEDTIAGVIGEPDGGRYALRTVRAADDAEVGAALRRALAADPPPTHVNLSFDLDVTFARASGLVAAHTGRPVTITADNLAAYADAVREALRDPEAVGRSLDVTPALARRVAANLDLIDRLAARPEVEEVAVAAGNVANAAALYPSVDDPGDAFSLYTLTRHPDVAVVAGTDGQVGGPENGALDPGSLNNALVTDAAAFNFDVETAGGRLTLFNGDAAVAPADVRVGPDSATGLGGPVTTLDRRPGLLALLDPETVLPGGTSTSAPYHLARTIRDDYFVDAAAVA